MNKIWMIVLSLALLLTPALQAGGGGEYPELTPQEKQRFYSALEDQITLAEMHLREVGNILGDPSMVSPAQKLDIKRAAEMLEVKQILAREFVGKKSIRSPVVRDLLLKTLSQDIIQPADLTNLQRVVDQEKIKIDEYVTVQAQQQAK